MNEIELREISFNNLDEVAALEVGQDQQDLIADNAYSIAQAFLDPDGDCRAAYFDGMPVGFFYTRRLDEERRLYICRFMIDHRQQRRGFGRKMMKKLLDTAFLSELIQSVDLAVARDPGNAEGFYMKCGFIPTGESYKGGWRMILPRALHFEHDPARQ